jgi:malonate decarboxylase epsilon subunit
MSLAFLYPGQGSQRPGMLHALPYSPAITRTLDQAATALDGLDGLDTAEALRSTTNTQLALLIAGVATARALTDDHGLVPAFVAGHSVGAFAAAATAGVLTFGEALAAVRLRGELMQQACASGRWGMAALIGLRLPTARVLVEKVGTDDNPLWIANINAADQIVLSGTVAALERAEPASRQAGARRWERLEVIVASHCPLQQSTANRLAEHLAGIPRRSQQVPYLTNTGGRRILDDSAVVLDDLAQAVAKPVQWYNATRLMSELGATCAIQMPPGHVLTRLLTGAAAEIHPVALAETGIDQAVAYARRHQQGAA